MRTKEIGMHKSLIIAALMIILPGFMMAQKGSSIRQNQQVTREKEPRFCTFDRSDAVNHYFTIDLTLLQSRFERVYFMNLCFQNNKVVSISGDINGGEALFSANKKYAAGDILDLFSELKKQAEDKALLLNSQEKKDWLLRNDKYTKAQ